MGLALSGGGSRAAAFHRGTVAALEELSLLSRVGVVSTVSGGSIFAAGWIAAAEAGESATSYLASLKGVLRRGFIRPALLSGRALKMLWPGYSRSRRMADVYDDLLTRGRPLDRAQSRGPLLCLNAAVLNHGQAGRFSLGGFSCKYLGQSNPAASSLPEFPVPGRTLGFATAASAAFPFGLPPLSLSPGDLGGAELDGPIQGHRRLILTDGGVLENLGTQLLMRSRRFGARHLIVSDAGTREGSWQPGRWSRLRAFAAFALTAETLEQVIQIMNAKQNRSMRQLVVDEVGGHPPSPVARKLLFVRVDQSWDRFLEAIPAWRRRELAATSHGRVSPPPAAAPARDLEIFLAACGVSLGPVRDLYAQIGGDDGANAANQVGTSLVGMPDSVLDLLAGHARWQVHASHAVYGPLPLLTAQAAIPAIATPAGQTARADRP